MGFNMKGNENLFFKILLLFNKLPFYSLWKTIKACPLLTIHEVLWLKVDIDGHIKHLEKMLTPVIEENQRLEALEKMILPLIEENVCTKS